MSKKNQPYERKGKDALENWPIFQKSLLSQHIFH